MKKEKVIIQLKYYRTEIKNMTQQELANQVGVSRQSINAIETGKFLPSIELSLKLARFFEVNVEELFYLGWEE
ncbi:helix-turn-helix transcriptional regulator [uncultured Enterococcus sp.]|uniref:helix-turn-helix transcriptional regulator n=1 Tax=uncultured Enterococcus sp. TaxID=167972 RepID=UPI002AA6E048|nr:helix-turn-helix transcriptional regulator [uncultured Enterococcus sp.]